MCHIKKNYSIYFSNCKKETFHLFPKLFLVFSPNCCIVTYYVQSKFSQCLGPELHYKRKSKMVETPSKWRWCLPVKSSAATLSSNPVDILYEVTSSHIIQPTLLGVPSSVLPPATFSNVSNHILLSQECPCLNVGNKLLLFINNNTARMQKIRQQLGKSELIHHWRKEEGKLVYVI